MAKSSTDKYANVAAKVHLQAVTDALEFAKIDFPFSIMDKVGILIHRVEWVPTSIGNLNSSGDTLVGALTTSNTLTDVTDPTDPQVIQYIRWRRLDIGTAASGLIYMDPYIVDYSDLPGGGILVAPSPLYLAVDSQGAAAACQINMRFFYTYLSLSSEDYWQLVESRRVIS